MEIQDWSSIIYVILVAIAIIGAGVLYHTRIIDLTIVIILAGVLFSYPLLKLLGTVFFWKKTEIKLIEKTPIELWQTIKQQLSEGHKYLGFNSEIKIPNKYIANHYQLLPALGYFLIEINREDLICYDAQYAFLPHSVYTIGLDLRTGKIGFNKEGYDIEDTERWIKQNIDLIKETHKQLTIPKYIKETIFQ